MPHQFGPKEKLLARPHKVRCLGVKQKSGKPCNKLFRSSSKFKRFCPACADRKQAIETGVSPRFFQSVDSSVLN